MNLTRSIECLVSARVACLPCARAEGVARFVGSGWRGGLRAEAPPQSAVPGDEGAVSSTGRWGCGSGGRSLGRHRGCV